MIKSLRILTVAAAMAAFSGAAYAAPVTVGPGGFDGGYATSITYDDAAARGTANDRDNALNALGAADGNFFEIGFGSFVDLTFGAVFDNSVVKVFEITFNNVAAFPESVDLYVGSGGSFTFVDSISNLAAQTGATAITGAGVFDTVRLMDTSTPLFGATTGGFDIDSVKVTPIPLPAGIALLGTGLAFAGFMSRRRRNQA
ncbi:VPLPA-CTERM sorting domain-containing protein [Roseibium sp. MMSF_3412]|uniref:VPLPA-CTERM sorting domain-containing protein n=1 Tax=Roseibium sp. MMSF_3412 TaxID=3046712 RepID=UPI00273E1F74|nr:VPLPA-CTERM sorting domain-containing protein [Roseibium sp. MMSF_3412]